MCVCERAVGVCISQFSHPQPCHPLSLVLAIHGHECVYVCMWVYTLFPFTVTLSPNRVCVCVGLYIYIYMYIYVCMWESVNWILLEYFISFM